MNKLPIDFISNFYYYIFHGIPVSFKSDFSLDESMSRLSDSVNSKFFSSPYKERPYGRVDGKKVKLQRFIPYFGNSYRPVFIGYFSLKESGVFLEGKWTTSLSRKFFGICKIAFIISSLLMVAITILGMILNNKHFANWYYLLLPPVIATIFLKIEVVFARLHWRNSCDDIGYLSNLITSVLTKEASETKVDTK